MSSLIELIPIPSASSAIVHCFLHLTTGLETLSLRESGKNTSFKSLKHCPCNPLLRLNPCNPAFITWHMWTPSDKHAMQMSCDLWTWVKIYRHGWGRRRHHFPFVKWVGFTSRLPQPSRGPVWHLAPSQCVPRTQSLASQTPISPHLHITYCP